MKMIRRRIRFYDRDKHVNYMHRNGFYKQQKTYWRKPRGGR